MSLELFDIPTYRLSLSLSLLANHLRALLISILDLRARARINSASISSDFLFVYPLRGFFQWKQYSSRGMESRVVGCVNPRVPPHPIRVKHARKHTYQHGVSLILSADVTWPMHSPPRIIDGIPRKGLRDFSPVFDSRS